MIRCALLSHACCGAFQAPFLIFLLSILTIAPPSVAQNSILPNEINPALDRAVERGTFYLVSQQNPDGSIGSGR
ncbi:MAG: hypothetical protein KIS87_08655, partial [Phycisphaeraceae bacterium]|nr:hypothetical protein [Phycisphaeraceae bacterium]